MQAHRVSVRFPALPSISPAARLSVFGAPLEQWGRHGAAQEAGLSMPLLLRYRLLPPTPAPPAGRGGAAFPAVHAAAFGPGVALLRFVQPHNPFVSICAALALLTPRVNPGSLYRGGKGT